MKKAALFAAAFLTIATTAHAAPFTFTGIFSGANEVPANASPGTGFARVDFDPVLHRMRVQADFEDLLGLVTASHVHCCTNPGANAGVATAVPTFPGFPLGVSSGSYSRTFDTSLASTFNPAFVTANGGTVAGAEAALLAGLLGGRAYFNIHSNQFPGGEIRANLTQVPEPTTLALFGVGLGAAAVRRRRRARH